MNFGWLKTTKGAEDGGAEVSGPKFGKLRDVVIVVAVTALLLCLIELLSGIVLAVKYRYINNPPTTKALAELAMFSPFMDKHIIGEECGEMYVKAPQPANREYLMEDSLLGFRLIPNNKYCFVRDIPLPAETFITNKEGFASIGQTEFEYARSKPAGTYRVIVIGGSTVWGTGSTTPGENLPARLLKGLRAKYPNIKFEVINAGVGGYSSRNELLYLISELVYYSPDLVIAYDGWNDSTFNGFMPQEHKERINSLKTPNHYDIDKRMANDRALGGTFWLFLGTLNEAIHKKFDWSATHRLLNRALPARNVIMSPKTYTDKSLRPSYDNSAVELYRDDLQMEIMASKLHKFKIALFLQPLMGVNNNRKLTAEEAGYYKMDEAGFPLKKSFYAAAVPMLGALKGQYKGDDGVCIADLSHALDDVPETVYNDVGHLYVNGNDAVASKIIVELGGCGFIR